MVALRSRWVLGVSLLACGAALLVALLGGTSSRADDPGASVVPSPGFAGPAGGAEVPALRTESSRTYRKADGSYQAQVSAGPVNYRDASGDWKPIDTDLASDGSGGLETTDTAAKVSLPESLDDPAKVTAGSRWVSFELTGADGDAAPTADGSTATYEDVLDGVDSTYDAQPTGVKETLTLADASAPASYRYTLDASSGLTAALLENGTVVFRDAGGVTRFWLPAPTVQEAGADSPTTDHVVYRLSADHQTLTVAVDPDWLTSATFPVQLDPSIWYGDDTSCTLASATPTVAACGGTTLKLGHDAAGKYRTALRFPDLALAVPRTASVMSAVIGLYFESQTSATASTPVTVSGLSKLLGAGATWNKYDTNAAHTWTTAGGDIVADPQAAITTLYPSYAAGWVNFNVSRLAERWLRSPSTNNGVLIRAQTETGTNNVISFDGHTWDHGGPTIRIDYEWHPGFESDQTFEQVAFDATSKIAVNAATGNLAVDSTDVSLPGVGGLDLKIRRTFNGQNLGNGGGMFGSAWSDGINNAAYATHRVWYDDSRTIYGNGNAIYRFDRDPVHDTATTHAYLSPPNINADLVSNISTGVATLTFRDTGITWTYRASYDGNNVTLAQISDPAGHHIDITPKSGQPNKIGSITDTNGAVLTFVYGTNGQLTKITKGATEWKYTTTIVNGHNLLTGYTNPTNQTTTYHYDAGALPGTWDKLDRVTDQTGQIFNLTYGPQGDWSQLTQLTQDFPDARPDNITKFSYKAAGTLGHACTTPVANSPYPNNIVFDRTVETDNAGRVTTYCYNTSAQVIQSWRPWDTTPPTITGVPNPFVFQDGYTNGVTPFVVGLSADDTPSGVKRVALEEVGHGELTSATSPCPATTTMPDLCPASFSSPVTINPAPLIEGAHVVRQTATDLAGNVATSATWNLFVDRTGPGQASGFVGYFDDTTNMADIAWDPPADPAAADGTPGSGVFSYTYRWRQGAGAWSGWINTSAAGTELPSTQVGSSFDIDVQAYDAVGNLGAGVSAHVVTVALPDTSDCLAHDVGGYPASCVDAAMQDSPMDEDDEGESVSLVADDAPSAFGAQPMTAGPLHTGFHITVNETNPSHPTPIGARWATIRNSGGKWAIGNAHQGWQFASDYEDDAIPTTGGSTRPWYRGRAIDPSGLLPVTTPSSGTHSTGCGWIVNVNVTPDIDPDPSAACGLGTGTNVMDLENFTLRTNCPPENQVPVDSHGEKVAHCTHGTMVYLTQSATRCADVGMTPMGQTNSACVASMGDTLSAGTCVKWRYITSDNKWVMVSDERRTNQAGRWFFIPRSSLASNPRRLPNILTHGRQGKCPGALG
jgi:YD repeat-containing protein